MKKHSGTILLVLIFFVGLAVMLYPTISDYIQQIRLMPDAPKSYHVVTYGCQMNAHDSEIQNAFIQRMLAAPDKISHCFNCLKACNPATAPYCITQALINAVVGDLDNGLIFCGSRVGEIREITTVPKLMQELTV